MEWKKLGEFIITYLSEKIFQKAWVFSVFHYTFDSDLHQASRNVAENTSFSGGGFWQESYASRIFSISKFASLLTTVNSLSFN